MSQKGAVVNKVPGLKCMTQTEISYPEVTWCKLEVICKVTHTILQSSYKAVNFDKYLFKGPLSWVTLLHATCYLLCNQSIKEQSCFYLYSLGSHPRDDFGGGCSKFLVVVVSLEYR